MIIISWGPSWVCGKTEDYYFLQCEEIEDIIFGKVKISTNLPHVKTEELQAAENVTIKSEDCILKCTDPKINSCGLAPTVVKY